MQEALRTYLELAMGLTEVSRKKVRKAVKDAVGRGGATAEQLRALSTDLLATSAANREALTKMVKFEVDRALGVVGLATAEEVADLTARLRDMERRLAEAKAALPGGAEPAYTTAPAKKAGAKKAGRKAAQAAPVEAAPVKRAAKKTAGARKAAATTSTGTTATKAAAKKAPAKKAVAKKAPAKKATKAASSRTPARRATKRAQA